MTEDFSVIVNPYIWKLLKKDDGETMSTNQTF